MATLTRINHRFVVQWHPANGGARQTLGLGRIPRSAALEICGHITDIVRCQRVGFEPPAATFIWLQKIGPGLHYRLVRTGLASPRVPEPMRKSERRRALDEARAEISRLHIRVSRLQRRLTSERRFNRKVEGIPDCLKEFEGQLVEFQVPSHGWPCVYFLIREGAVVYIGQTSAIHQRMSAHVNDGKIFDRVLAVRVQPDRLDIAESTLIERFAPVLNVAGITGCRPASGGVLHA